MERDEVRALLAEAYQAYADEMPPDVYEAYLASVLDTDEVLGAYGPSLVVA